MAKIVAYNDYYTLSLGNIVKKLNLPSSSIDFFFKNYQESENYYHKEYYHIFGHKRKKQTFLVQS